MPRSTLCHVLLILLLTVQAGGQKTGIFSKNPSQPGYYLVTSIPEGAKFINVTELSRTRNFLAVRLQNGTYLFNEDYNIVSSGKYRGAGTTFVYIRRNDYTPETFYAPGPLSSAVDVMLIYQHGEPEVFYQYELPDHLTTISTVPPKVVTKPFDIEVLPTPHLESATSENIMMRDETRSSTPMPTKKRRRRKKYMWTSTGFANCSKPCGGGFQSKKYICMTQRTRKHVASKKCESLEKPRSEPVGCNNNPCEPQWEGTPWSKCSVTCGNGTRTRQLYCIKKMVDSLKIRLDDRNCASQSTDGIALVEACHMPDCDMYSTAKPSPASKQQTLGPSPRWKIQKWSPCSVTCGNGTRTRLVTCINALGKGCNAEDKPATEEACSMGNCKATSVVGNEIPEALTHMSWLYSAWPDECSAECGSGMMSRRLYCENFTKNDTCTEDKMPMINKICVSQQLCGQWFVGPWTKCSSSCDMGMETREVACVSKFLGVLKVVQPSNCQGNPPEQTRGCMGPPCNATWFMSDWTRCSRNCGRGYQKRKVQCIGPDGIPMNASVLECDEEKRPPSRRHCNDFSCNKNKSKDVDSENDVEKECRDVLLDCWKIRSGSQEAKHKCEMEVFKKGCCKACRYSFLRSNGRSKIR